VEPEPATEIEVEATPPDAEEVKSEESTPVTDSLKETAYEAEVEAAVPAFLRIELTDGFTGVMRSSRPSRKGRFLLFVYNFLWLNTFRIGCENSLSHWFHEIIGRIPWGNMETNLVIVLLKL
jgi:hypothetical protein